MDKLLLKTLSQSNDVPKETLLALESLVREKSLFFDILNLLKEE